MDDNISILRNGISRQMIGVGTYKASAGGCMKEIIHTAWRLGYRGIDTAEHYGNESEIGEALRTCNYNREELFLPQRYGMRIMVTKRPLKHLKEVNRGWEQRLIYS